jgi:hypothetical protein
VRGKNRWLVDALTRRPIVAAVAEIQDLASVLKPGLFTIRAAICSELSCL